MTTSTQQQRLSPRPLLQTVVEMARSSKQSGGCWTGIFLFLAVGIPVTVYNVLHADSGDDERNLNNTLHEKYDKNGNIACRSNDSFSREELIAVVKYLSVERPQKRIYEHNERKDIGIAAVVLTVITFFFMVCLCGRMEDLETEIQSQENTLRDKRKKIVRMEALKKVREEIEGKEKMKVEDVELDSLKSSINEKQDVRGEEERRVVVINTGDMDQEDQDHTPEINIANSVVYINSTPPSPTLDLATFHLSSLQTLDLEKK